VGTTVTPDVGALVLTGYAPSLALERAYLAYRLTIPGVGSVFAPGDPDPLPDTDFYITSKRGQDHPWIAQAGDGPNAGPDLSVGGQELQMPLGRTVDGEVQIRVIDVAAPIATVACDIDAVLIAEGLGLIDATTLFADGWSILGHTQGLGYQFTKPAPPTSSAFGGWWVDLGGEPAIAGSALFFWIDYDPPHMGSYSWPPWVRDTWMERTFDGTEGGGPAFTPGQKVGVHFRLNWTLQTGTGAVFVEANGQRVTGLAPGFDFWDMPLDALNNQVNGVVWCTVDGAGEILVKMGDEGISPSGNVSVTFSDLEFVECDDVITSVDTERYVTSWLADSDARQQLLGRKAYLEESLDGGATWTRVLYSGYLRQAELGASLTYLLTLGDAGRGRRNTKAWSGLNPVEDFVP